MQNVISERVQRWASQELGAIDFNALHAEIEFLTVRRFNHYLPTTGPHPDFWVRLANWLENDISEDDKKVLFRLVPHIFFLGHDELMALQRAAFRGPVLRWLIDQLGITFADPVFESQVQSGIGETWFCPITDSANISDFYHLNAISGVEHRIEWRAFSQLLGGDSTKLQEHMNEEGYKRVVLIEDLVGSGSQMSDLKPIFDHLPNSIPILLSPLVVCPAGAKVGRQIAAKYPNINFDSVFELPDHSFVARLATANEPSFFGEVRDLVQRTFLTVSAGEAPSDLIKPYGPFGWRNTGALIVTYNNTPDNTLPIIQHTSSKWSPLFPRSSRID
jgi:hypothetical protein